MNKVKNFGSMFLLLLLVTVLVLQLTGVGAVFANSTENSVSKAMMQKGEIVTKTLGEKTLSQDMLNRMEKLSNEETLPVAVWRKGIEQDDLERNVAQTGFGIKSRSSMFANAKSITQNNITDAVNSISQNRDQYKNIRLNSIEKLTADNNRNFMGKYSLTDNKIYYKSKYTSTLIMDLTKEEISTLMADEEVLDITYFEDLICQPDTWAAVDQIRAAKGTASKPGLKHSSFGGLTGVGIKIGIIEANGGRYDPENRQLKPKHTDGTLSFVPVPGVSNLIDFHPTMVTAIICGAKKSELFRPYVEGVATGATVYQSGIVTATDCLTAFTQFASLGVDVINYSAGSATDSYSWFDKEIDNLIYQTKIVFVKSAGNRGATDGNVTSPGKAYNAITVGSVESKSDYYSKINPPYNVSPTSSYNVPSFLTNKPEVVAPGANIILNVTLFASIGGSGTSFAAPLVTGVIAQLMQKTKPYIDRENYVTYYKAILMVGAEDDLVRDSSVRPSDPASFHNKGGAGLVNGINSAICGELQIYCKLYEMYSYGYMAFPYHTSYSPFRAALVFEKPENMYIEDVYDNNFDLALIRASTRLEIASSRSIVNNFEILESAWPGDGEVLLGFQTRSIIPSNLYMSVSVVWRAI